jgi:hypothetical protein
MITLNIPPNARVSPTTYHMGQINSIYNIPKPLDEKYVVAIASFSGGLHCRMNSNGVLKSGDCKTYWTNIGIPVEKHPQVIIVPVKGEKNYPTGRGTFENTMDVEIIGGACPSPNLTILLYLTNMSDTFFSLFSHIYENPFVLNGNTYKPNVIACCWNIPEELMTPIDLNRCNDLFKKITDSGINICIASGDKGANVTFPASSPYVTSIGGTTLNCSNNIYDSSTKETVWNRTGSGTSKIFPKPNYQNIDIAKNRCIPDIALCANPNSGILLYYNSEYVTGGGTSSAAPIFAGYLAAIGCKVFVNPLLYTASKDCFHDITRGSNGKYIAKKGPDLCTGLGSIDGVRLQSVLVTKTPNTPLVKTKRVIRRAKPLEPVKETLKDPIKETVKAIEPLEPVKETLKYPIKETVKAIEPIKRPERPKQVSIRINVTRYTLKIKKTIQLTAYLVPSGILKWSSSNKNVTVDGNGLVTANSNGTCTVSAFGEGAIAKCEIVVI